MSKKREQADVFSRIGKHQPVIPQIDVLKAFAIILVIILHAFPTDNFLHIGGSYYIWQAVPILIIINGFTIAYAYQRYGSTTVKQCYDIALIIKRYKRLLIPFTLCWIIEIGIITHMNQLPVDPIQTVVSFFTGGFGWGAYFIPVIIQSVIIVPIFYILALRNPERMLIIALIITILFDIITILIGWDTAQTSLFYFRFLFAGALGVWIVTTKNRWNIWMIIGIVISFVYVTVCSYTSILNAFPDFHGYGGALQAPGFMWAGFLVLLGLQFLPGKINTGLFHYIGEVGKASWHIFLAQMVYYLLPVMFVYTLLEALLAGAHEIVLYSVVTTSNVAICVCVGYYWYYTEKMILQRIQKSSS